MTTQQSYPEHSDGNSSVVEDASVSETTTSSPSESVAAPVGEETFAPSSAAESQSSVQEQASQSSQAAQDEQHEQHAAFASEQLEGQGAGGTDHTNDTDTTLNQSGGETMNETSGEQTAATTDNDNAAEFAAEIVAEISLPSSDEPALQETFSQTGGIPVVEEDVRPFSEIIEEFRQSEARFNSALEEARADTHDTHDTHNTQETPVASSSIEEVFVPEFTMPENASQAGISATSETNMESNTPTAVTTEAASTPTAPAARPVSPLLRPATRLRAPRHAARQRDEVRAAHQAPAQPTPEASQPQQTVEAKAEPETQATQVAETAPVETPRPARRYRFDRPAQTTTPAPAAPSAPTPAVPTQNGNGLTNGHSGFVGRTPTVERETAQQPEQNAVQPTVTEPADEKTQDTAPVEPERRRKHGQERQRGKEHVAHQSSTPETPVVQQSQTPLEVADVVALVNTLPAGENVATPNEEVAPEDLPPLEYADLQKASTRRRRRRHTNGATVAALTGNTPSVTPAPAVSTPPTAPAVQAAPVKPAIAETPVASTAPATLPQRPAATTSVAPATANAGQYSITSGFTVSQMNNGNENRGPFMGPDPSPARGTIAAQNTRSIRTDAQRTPAYPVRSTEATSASVNQLANIVAQAIQTQTDRMIAELRRSNQAPTNISVSMPPFPSTERVGVFVDVANLLYSARTLRMTVDFGKLLDFLRGNRRLVRAQAYCPTSPQPGDEQMFLQAVKGLGYRITTKNYKTFSSGAKKADLDLDLCMDVVRLVDGNAVDCVVLVSGDSDFMPMLDYCSDHGVRVEVAAFDEAMSATLRQSCDLFINLSMLDEIRA